MLSAQRLGYAGNLAQRRQGTMRVIIERCVKDEPSGVGGPELVVVAEWRRRDHSMADLGMTLAEGRDLLANVQSALLRQQAAG